MVRVSMPSSLPAFWNDTSTLGFPSLGSTRRTVTFPVSSPTCSPSMMSPPTCCGRFFTQSAYYVRKDCCNKGLSLLHSVPRHDNCIQGLGVPGPSLKLNEWVTTQQFLEAGTGDHHKRASSTSGGTERLASPSSAMVRRT